MYRLRIIEHGFINFDAHPVSGVFFVCTRRNGIIQAPERVLFVFRGKPPEYKSQRKIKQTERRFYVSRNYNTD